MLDRSRKEAYDLTLFVTVKQSSRGQHVFIPVRCVLESLQEQVEGMNPHLLTCADVSVMLLAKDAS
jgi:hypothetical protein